LLPHSVSPRIALQSCGIYSEASELLLQSAVRTIGFTHFLMADLFCSYKTRVIHSYIMHAVPHGMYNVCVVGKTAGEVRNPDTHLLPRVRTACSILPRRSVKYFDI